MWHVLRSSDPKRFVILWLFILFVSVVDGYLVLRFRHIIEITELNPIGQMLIAASGGRVWGLLAVKFAGTVLAGGVLLLIYRRNAGLAMIIAGVLAGLQMCLLLFLLLV